MFVYEKKLQYPVKIKNTNPKLAALIISQYGGPYPNKLRKHPTSGCFRYPHVFAARAVSRATMPSKATRSFLSSAIASNFVNAM